MNGSPLKNIVVSHDYIDQLAGTIKYDAWEYEKESRHNMCSGRLETAEW